MAVFWSYFRDFVGAQKIEDLSESKIRFSEKKTMGVRCTLTFRMDKAGVYNANRLAINK